jgi:hypothetical protein
MTNPNLLWIPSLSLDTNYTGVYHDYFINELHVIHDEIAKDRLSAAKALQGVLIESLLFGRVKFDWLGAVNELLVRNGKALAYSESFSSHLYGFTKQWEQYSIGAAYSQYWIRKKLSYAQLDCGYLDAKKDATGLYFDHDISPTKTSHRMKTELMASLAMVLEMNEDLKFLKSLNRGQILSALDDSMVFPRYRYLSLEYFRKAAMESLDEHKNDADVVDAFLKKCSLEARFGWSDFVMSEKLDDYMGTAKRTSRDTNIHSPMLALYADSLAGHGIKNLEVKNRLTEFKNRLIDDPWDIPAFKMRDLPYNFGSGITTLEALAAIVLTEK